MEEINPMELLRSHLFRVRFIEPTNRIYKQECCLSFDSPVAIEIPYTLAQVSIYGVVVYAMMGFEWTAAKFFLNTFFMFITVILFIYYGIMVVAVSPSQAAAAVIFGVFYSVWNLFSGFIIPRPRIIVWWRWYAWLFPISWSLWGMSSSKYGDFGSQTAVFLVPENRKKGNILACRYDWWVQRTEPERDGIGAAPWGLSPPFLA